MCGRFVVAGSNKDLVDLFDVDTVGDNLPEPSWNISPTDPIRVVMESLKEDQITRRMEAARWWLTPSFSKELKTKAPTFNARSETVGSKPTFKPSLESRRALIPASGYYEWRTEGKTKIPFYIHLPGEPVVFAGLYAWWRNRELPDDHPNRWVLSSTILTREAVGPVAEIHDRTPVTLPREFWNEWLNPATKGTQELADEAVAAATPVAERLQFHEVGPVREDSPLLIEPLNPA
ncbi:SOS response-associated peptidase [uncultured Arthrobacter sp.]|uniref:SOS response-associated peptidase n=1 Tax=uncultured Arthrobacter sp. TaxID=114050 RepID=UPI002627EE4D|nr:SOS response-associated peptidase [uncultured Arthrobacter sp.]